MGERVTKVTLRSVTAEYIEGMRRAADETQRVGTSAEKLAQQKQALESLGRTGLIAGTALAAGLALAVARSAEFEKAMSQVNAVTDESAVNQERLRDAALEAGGATIYTAREAANAQEELAKAGLETADILGGALTGALDLAASGQLEVARAGEITAITLKQFNLEGAEAARVADVLSAGANKAVGSVEDLAQGLKFVGPVANSMNVSMEDTVATLALFADQGILGEQAGTSLRGMLASLTSPSKAANEELKRLNVSLYDGSGKFKGLENVAGELNRVLHDTDDASRDASLGIIFGNQQVTAARILVDAGAESWRDYRTSVDDSGIAARIAAERMDNLSGDVEKLGGAFDTALIKTGSGANEQLRGLVQSVTFLVDGVGELPQPVLDAGFAVGAFGAATLLASGAAFTAVPRIADMKNALSVLGTTGRTAAVGIGSATVALGAVTLLLSHVVASEAERKQVIDSFRDSLDQATGSVTDYTRELIVQQLQEEGAIEVGKRLGLGVDELVDMTLSGKKSIQEWGDARRTANAEDAAAVTQYDTVSGALEVVAGKLDRGRELWDLNRQATEASRKATEASEGELARLEGRAETTGDEIENLSDIIRGFASATLNTRDAERQFQAALDDASAAVEQNGATLDINTDKGRANEAALDDIAQSAKEVAAAKYEETGSQEAATAAIQAGRNALIEQLAKYGIVGAEAEAYADKLGLIPGNIGTAVDLDTAAAMAELQIYLQAINTVNSRRDANRTTGGALINANGGMYDHAQSFAGGGMPNGIYSGGKPLYMFAEPETKWETFISGKSGMERQNFGYAFESMMRLGSQMGLSLGRPASAAPASGSQGPTRVVGTLDMGNGLTGYIDAVLADHDERQAVTDLVGTRMP